MLALAQLLLSHQRRFIFGLGAAFLAGQDLLGAEQLHGFSVDGLIKTRHPEDGLGFTLAACSGLRDGIVQLRPCFRQGEMEGEIALHRQPAAEHQAGLEHLHIEQAVLGLWLPKAYHDFRVDSADVARLRREAAPLPLPVVFRRCRDAVTSIPGTDKVGTLKLR